MVKEALTQQLEAGLIRRSTSEWASPLHVVIKPDGTIRLTVDYKILNAAIEYDAYPMPNTHKLLQEITQSKWFSKFDFLKAYHQIPVERKSIKYTAFICEFGLFEYLAMPMGIRTFGNGMVPKVCRHHDD